MDAEVAAIHDSSSTSNREGDENLAWGDYLLPLANTVSFQQRRKDRRSHDQSGGALSMVAVPRGLWLPLTKREPLRPPPACAVLSKPGRGTEHGR